MLLDTPICAFGTPAPAFDLADAYGVRLDLPTAMGKHGLLVAFICNHCPYVQAIITRLVADAKLLHTEGVHTVAIMTNDYHMIPADNPQNMKAFSAQHGMEFPYLIDETQDVGRAYGAVCTPDFFGYNTDFALQYRGRLDDIKRGDVADRTPELLTAMRQIAATGHGPKAQIPSMGCSIKWRN